jgi:hypothetical protein
VSDETLQRAFRDAILAETPEYGALPPRVAIYRRLVRNTLEGVVYKLLPRTREHMGVAFDDSVARFLEEEAPRTHYLRDVPFEFVRWATPRWKDEGAAPWLVDLARHEIASFAVSTVPHLPEPKAEEVALDRPLLFNSLVRIERYAHVIHEDAVPPDARDIALLYYRDDAHALRTLELTPLAAALLERAPSMPLQQAIAKSCEETNIAMNDETLASIARLLADLGERGILLGAR